jgi:hypothetical protein
MRFNDAPSNICQALGSGADAVVMVIDAVDGWRPEDEAIWRSIVDGGGESGRGVVENKHSSDPESRSPNHPPPQPPPPLPPGVIENGARPTLNRRNESAGLYRHALISARVSSQ